MKLITHLFQRKGSSTRTAAMENFYLNDESDFIEEGWSKLQIMMETVIVNYQKTTCIPFYSTLQFLLP